MKLTSISLISLLSFSGLAQYVQAQNVVVANGSNDWVLHAPSGASYMVIAPKINGSYAWSRQFTFRNNGDLTTSGSLGLGTASLSGYRLAVNGTIRAKEVRVNTGWSDFVFEEDYSLPTLSEVESHIKAHKHLPDIPSAAEVEAEGVELGVISSKLLQKVEELTLYVIAQEKRINQQNERIEVLEAENAGLKE